jgi:hypothetical protein
VGDVAELKSLTTEPNLVLGGNMSLTEAMDTFNRISKEYASYRYTKILADHIDMIANVPVRNVSTHLCYSTHIFCFIVTVSTSLGCACKWTSSDSTIFQFCSDVGRRPTRFLLRLFARCRSISEAFPHVVQTLANR